MGRSLQIRTKRIYEPPAPGDGWRVLVDRLWPRGIPKAQAAVDHWARDLAPSPQLRRWFGHDPQRWNAFQQRYRAELEQRRAEVAALVEQCPRATLTLLFAARDTRRNNAVVLREFIEREILGRQ